jgi:hypothetical protein
MAAKQLGYCDYCGEHRTFPCSDAQQSKNCGYRFTVKPGDDRINFVPCNKAWSEIYIAKDNDPLSPNHYAKYKIEPIDFILGNNLPFAVGNVIKYVLRYKDKNGLEDLKKAKTYIDLLIKHEYGEGA